MDTVEKRINRLPEGQFELALRVRELILAADPEMTEQLHFSTPFFSCRGWLCYLHLPEDGSLEVNFVKGNRLEDPHSLLEARNRKVVRGLVYRKAEDFGEELFVGFLKQAIELNPAKAKKRRQVKT